MLHWIIGNLNSTSTVTTKRSRIWAKNSKISQQPTKPNNFCSGCSKSSKFCFCTWPWNCSLFLGFPGNGRSTKKNAIARNRTTISSITCPGSIRISMQLGLTGSSIIQAFWWCPYEIPQDPKQVCIMDRSGCTYKLAKNMNCMCNIRSSGSKVDKTTYKMTISRGILKRNTIIGSQFKM